MQLSRAKNNYSYNSQYVSALNNPQGVDKYVCVCVCIGGSFVTVVLEDNI